MKSNKFNFIFISIASIVMLLFVYFTNDMTKLITVIKNARLSWLMVGFLCMLLYWLLESGVLYCTANSIKRRLSFLKAFQTTMVGQLFNNITPFASGGQPMQLYYLTQEAFHLGEASSILLMKFIVYQGSLVIYSTIMLIGRFSFFMGQISKIGYLVFIGFGVNVLVIIGLIMIGYYPKITTKLVKGILVILSRMHIVKNIELSTQKAVKHITEFHCGFKILMNQKRVLLRTILISTLQLTAFFAIPYCICMALNIVNVPFFSILAASSFVLMVSSFVPLPGASGGAEGSFYLFFGIFFVEPGLVAIAIIFWRLITFYLPVFVGIFFCQFKKGKSTNIV